MSRDLPFNRPRTSDGHPVYINDYVKWSENGQDYVGRVRAFNAWGLLQVVIQPPHEIRGHEVYDCKVQFSHGGF